jgi:hypothetical protein
MYFKSLKLANFNFCSSNGSLKIDTLSHMQNRINLDIKSKNSIESISGLSSFKNFRDKISDNFYLDTFKNVLNELKSLLS